MNKGEVKPFDHALCPPLVLNCVIPWPCLIMAVALGNCYLPLTASQPLAVSPSSSADAGTHGPGTLWNREERLGTLSWRMCCVIHPRAALRHARLKPGNASSSSRRRVFSSSEYLPTSLRVSLIVSENILNGRQAALGIRELGQERLPGELGEVALGGEGSLEVEQNTVQMSIKVREIPWVPGSARVRRQCPEIIRLVTQE